MVDNPIPQAALTELLDWVDVKFCKDGSIRVVHMPRDRELMRAMSIVCPDIPHTVDEVHAQLLEEVWRVIPIFKYDFLYERPKLVSTLDAVSVPAPVGSAYWESYVKGSNTPELLELCARNNIQFQRHETNGGLTAMRARNACYAALRQGKVFH